MEDVEPSTSAVYVPSHLNDQCQAVVLGGSMVGHLVSCTTEAAFKGCWTVRSAHPRKLSDDCKCICMCFDVVEPSSVASRSYVHAAWKPPQDPNDPQPVSVVRQHYHDEDVQFYTSHQRSVLLSLHFKWNLVYDYNLTTLKVESIDSMTCTSIVTTTELWVCHSWKNKQVAR